MTATVQDESRSWSLERTKQRSVGSDSFGFEMNGRHGHAHVSHETMTEMIQSFMTTNMIFTSAIFVKPLLVASYR